MFFIIPHRTISEESRSTSVKTLDHVNMSASNYPRAFAYTAAPNQTLEGLSSESLLPKSPSRNIFEVLLGETPYRGQAFYIMVYTIFIISVALSTNLKAAYFFRYCMRISINIHEKMFSSLIRAPIKFFDENPSGKKTFF